MKPSIALTNEERQLFYMFVHWWGLPAGRVHSLGTGEASTRTRLPHPETGKWAGQRRRANAQVSTLQL